jgi:hypothetical protein
MSEQSQPPSTIRSGLKFGLGFSIPFVVLYGLVSFASVAIQKRYLEEFRSAFGDKNFGPESGLEILYDEPRSSEQNLVVLGKIGNKSDDIWESIRFQVNLFDATDKFVGMCRGSSTGPLYPGEERFFEVDCHGSKKEPMQDYSRYEIQIANAFHKSKDGT